MISYMSNCMSWIVLTLQNLFFIASFVGKLIVSATTEILTAIYNIVTSVFYFLQIVYEDNVTTFTEELPSFSDNLFNTITQQILNIQDGLHIICNDIISSIIEGLHSVKVLFTSTFIVINEVCLLFKNAIIFIGDVVWFLVTFIPVHLPLLIKTVTLFITQVVGDVVINGYMSLLRVTNFLTDVPLQSFTGIVSAVLILRLSIHYKDYILSLAHVLYWSCYTKILYLYHTVCNWFSSDPDIREIARSGGDGIINAVDFIPDDGNDALCVICAERQKCVLTLPCRHVCLCADCCRRLYRYQRTCPICRTFIYHSVTIYL